MLKIYNSLTRKKEDFHPIEENKVRMYVCGVTVYDYCHIGHARTYTAFDVIVRYFRHCNYEVTYVRNITDIDDKIIKRAAENGESIEALTSRFTKIMHEDFARLGILKPGDDPKVTIIEPKATENIDEMQAMIKVLIGKEYAYPREGNVYYHVEKFKNYGKLSHQNLEGLQAGIRVEVSENKKNPLDFVLWKAAKPGEKSYPSEWGEGRPGWHIECSAMAHNELGAKFDIHGGGSDLQFPHHENEIAQSQAFGDDFAKYWMHTGMVKINEEKMSKSLNNFFVIDDVLKNYHAEFVRYFLISGHYRSEINYSDENLNLARTMVKRLYRALRGVAADESKIGVYESSFIIRFEKAMNDDFNTPEALAVLADLASALNTCKRSNDPVGLDRARSLAAVLIKLGSVLGILQAPEDNVFPGNAEEEKEIERLIELRNLAKQAKNYAEADVYRDQILAKGVLIMDTPAGTEWEWH